MADDALAGVNSMVSSLNQSIDKALKALQQQNSGPTGPVQAYAKTVNKSSLNTPGYATDIGILAKNTTRLTAASNLAANDPADFLKFKVVSKGEVTLGQIGDDGVRVQLMSKLGVVIADSNKDSGDTYDAYKNLQDGNLTLDRGDYTLRITRDKGVAATEPKNYAVQLIQGDYSQDYDTTVKQPKAGDSPFKQSVGDQALVSGLNSALQNMQSMTYGQTGTQKLMGSFSLFI